MIVFADQAMREKTAPNLNTVYESDLDDTHEAALVEKPFHKTILRRLYFLIFEIFNGSYKMNQRKPRIYLPNRNIYHANSVSTDQKRYAQVKLQKRIHMPMKT